VSSGADEALPSPPALARSARVVPWLAPLLVFAVALRAVNAYPVGATHDDAVYVVLAKALATGQGFRYLNLPGAPLAAHFPPGYPALLALLWWAAPAFPANVVVFKIVNALLVAVAAFWLVRFAQARVRLSAPLAGAVAVVLSIGVPTLVLSALVMSEPLFLAIALPVLLLGERLGDGERDAGWLVAAGLLAGIATLVRSQGIALVGALVLVLCLRRRFRDAFVCGGVAAAVVAPWQWWVHAHAGGLPAPLSGTYGPYGPWFADAVRTGGLAFVVRTLGATSHAIASMLALLVAPVPGRAAGVAALALLLGLAALGAWRLWGAAPVTALFLALYLGIVLVWPYTPARFVWGVWPLLVALPLLGIRALWRWELPAPVSRRARAWLLVAAAVPAVGYLRYNVRGYRGAWWENIPRQRGEELRAVVMKIRADTPAGAVLCSNDDAAIYLYTGHQAVPSASAAAADFLHPPTVAKDANVLRDILTAYHVDGVIVTTPYQRDVADLLVQRHPPVLALTDSFPSGLIYSPIPR